MSKATSRSSPETLSQPSLSFCEHPPCTNQPPTLSPTHPSACSDVRRTRQQSTRSPRNSASPFSVCRSCSGSTRPPRGDADDGASLPRLRSPVAPPRPHRCAPRGRAIRWRWTPRWRPGSTTSPPARFLPKSFGTEPKGANRHADPSTSPTPVLPVSALNATSDDPVSSREAGPRSSARR